ncbi:class I SAM-dependent methyltransferase [Endozoicomonas sp. G2_2]|uniref:O-methyltransferase n=1 Tax=Endozoicomonas sp. G2_2 TaxID=2821092 RepID=UPI001AD95C5D|nr:class I SAM-dependent methyltransferase [Endozoicomonas sp. G2_2]MBO9469759.1 class I SAM-dependent methyltransferase [Endozoicomonas sp. G2_2]
MFDSELVTYLRHASLRETDIMVENRRVTAARDDANLQVDPEQGQLIALLVQLMGARRGIEIGVYAGYSSLWIAQSLPASGRLLACDIDAEITQRAQRDWAAAGLADRIELRLGPALATLDNEIAAGMAGQYDFVFIDADKAGYIDYYERALALVHAGGLIIADNTLWHGRVIDPDDRSTDTQAIRDFNRYLHGDERIDLSLVPIGDGLTLARKR